MKLQRKMITNKKWVIAFEDGKDIYLFRNPILCSELTLGEVKTFATEVEEVEDNLIEVVEFMLEHFNMDLNEILEVIKKRVWTDE